jgi:hypothetical protein
MRQLRYTDEDGMERVVLLRDCDPDDPALGVQISPPPVDRLRLLTDDERKRIHGLLTKRGLYRWRNVIAQQDGITGVVGVVSREFGWDRAKTNDVRRQVVALYKEYEREEQT